MIVTLTGPRSVGKSTVSRLVARRLGLPCVSSDKIGENALKKEGWLDKAIKSGKILTWVKKHGYTLIEEQYKKDNFVFDLSGGSISSQNVGRASSTLRRVVRKRSIVVGLLPYRSAKRSVDLLFSREREGESTLSIWMTKSFLQKQGRAIEGFPHSLRIFVTVWCMLGIKIQALSLMRLFNS